MMNGVQRYSSCNAKKLAKARLPYERLGQLTMEVLTGVRKG